MALRYVPGLAARRWALAFPPVILALNILEAVIRDFQVAEHVRFGVLKVERPDPAGIRIRQRQRLRRGRDMAHPGFASTE